MVPVLETPSTSPRDEREEDHIEDFETEVTRQIPNALGTRQSLTQNAHIAFTYADLSSMTNGNILECNLPTLKAIYDGAPEDIRESVGRPRTSHSYVVALMRIQAILRQRCDDTAENQDSLKRTLALSPEEIDELRQQEPATLSDLVTRSLRADQDLYPRQFDSNNVMEMKKLIYRWQATLRKSALERRQPSGPSDNRPSPHSPRPALRQLGQGAPDLMNPMGSSRYPNGANRPLQPRNNGRH